ncbi:hypothetical protein [Amycolatopsis sp. NPDC051903]|uniref:hypothetical protein n=1 Tax=Amycolatopsis sp. NPDC051903 TaxID=3363936 RepID=UPI00378B58E5
MDELDLVRQLKEAPALRPEAYERARSALGTAMAAAQTSGVPDAAAATARKKFSWLRDFRLGVAGKVGIGAVGALAAAAVVVSVAVPHPAAPAGPTPHESAAGSPLVTLAADVKASGGSVTGDASLVIRSTTAPNGEPYVTYAVYSDSGHVYFAESKSGLPALVARNENVDDPSQAREVAAARFAASGDLDQAREQMVNATNNYWGLGLSAEQQQKLWDEGQAQARQILQEKGVANPPQKPRPTGKALQDGIDNTLWTNTIQALDLGAGNPDVRAGVLRLISTIPDVTVTNSKTGGQPSLVLTAGPALFQGDEQEVLTINAGTGLPISAVATPKTGKPVTATYESSRVTLADVKAGKF